MSYIETTESSQASLPDISAGHASHPSGIATFRRYVRMEIRANPGAGFLILAGLIIEMAFNSAVPISFKFLVDSAIVPRNEKVLLVILVALTGGVIVVSAAGVWRDFVYARFFTGLLNNLRLRMFSHLQKLSMDYFARSRNADILARFSTDLAAVENALASALPNCALPALELIFNVLLLFLLEWRLALVSMLVFPVCLIGPRLITPRAVTASYQRKENEAKTMTAVEESVAAQSVIKAFSMEQPILERFVQRIATLRVSSTRVGLLGSMIERTSGIGTLVLQVVVFAVGAYLSFHGDLTIGSLVSFQALFVNFSSSLACLAQYYPMLVQSGAGMQRIDEMLDEKPLVVDGPDAGPLPSLSRDIRFEGVHFGYVPGQVTVNDLSFTIPARQSVAFVGPSGAGKTTLLNLFIRFYEPERGRVLWDGHDARGASQESLRRQIGVVFPNSILFNTTIRENIRIGKTEATDQEVEAAARAAEVHDAILALPHGYETAGGDQGGGLSEELRQRIGLVRALLRDPRVLILDEATVALDPETEGAINRTIDRLSQGRTVISTTHRLASVVTKDRIFLLHEGRVSEEGTHQELLARGGRYASLWEKQGGFILADGGRRARVETARLRAIPMLQSLDDSTLEALADAFVTERFPAERDIVLENDPADKFYLVARGRLSVLVNAGGTRRQVGTLDDGDYFGEIALIEETPRIATVRTRTESILLSLRRERFFKLMDKEPKLASAMEKVASARRTISQEAKNGPSEPPAKAGRVL